MARPGMMLEREGRARRSSWRLADGDEIGGGRLALGRLGGGVMYETYLAWDPELHALVVAKILRPSHVGDPSALRRLHREANLLASVHHPVVVRLFDFVGDGPRPHLVLEHLDGVTLRQVLDGQRGAPLEEVLPLALHVCSALHYLHGRGIVHLDVTPKNVVMEATPRLIDFSLARTRADAAAITHPGVGTRLYLSPEQCDPRGYGPLGPASDVWGLGVTLWEAVANRNPFDVEGHGEHPQLQVTPAAFHRDVPAPLVDILRRCLSIDPASRPAPAEIVLALQPLVARLPRPLPGKKRLRFV